MARRPRRTIGSLDARSGAILRAVIDEYVTSATPVSSSSLVSHYPMGVSSATVRNILSDLEAAGSADASPHLGRTSAHRRGLSLLRPGSRRRVVAAARRAAHDPPPVRPGRVRERALVPACGEHAGCQHRHRRSGHHGQGSGGSRAARGPGHGAGPPGVDGGRLPRRDHEAGSPEPAPGRGPGAAEPRRGAAERAGG